MQYIYESILDINGVNSLRFGGPHMLLKLYHVSQEEKLNIGKNFFKTVNSLIKIMSGSNNLKEIIFPGNKIKSKNLN